MSEYRQILLEATADEHEQRAHESNGTGTDDEGERAEEPVEKLAVHPVAAMFPMMTDDELEDLADDILANGLVHPIVVGPNGEIIDGRNRYEACQRRGIVPQFVALDADADPVAYIISANVTRRHLNKGQQAMAVARARSLNEQPIRSAVRSLKLSTGYVAQAALVLDYAPELADTVLAGATPLNTAYEEARRLKEEARRREEEAASDEAKFATLQANEPDLAAMVQEERLTLAEVLAAAKERQREREEAQAQAEADQRRLSARFHTMLSALECPEKTKPDEWAISWLDADPSMVGEGVDFSAERAERAADTLMRYARLKREKEHG